MTERTWRPFGDGEILDREDLPDAGPEIRAYIQPDSWEVTAESPYGATTMAAGEADDLDDAREKAIAAHERIVGGGSGHQTQAPRSLAENGRQT